MKATQNRPNHAEMPCCPPCEELELHTPVGLFRGWVICLSDGCHIAMGEILPSRGCVVLMKLDTTGNVDSTFGSEGMLFTNLQAGSIQLVTEQSDGRLLLGGFSAGRMLIARYLPDGKVDRPFGHSGCTHIALESVLSLNLSELLSQADGTIFLLGNAYVSNKGFLTLKVQLQSNGTPDRSFNGGTPLLWGITS